MARGGKRGRPRTVLSSNSMHSSPGSRSGTAPLVPRLNSKTSGSILVSTPNTTVRRSNNEFGVAEMEEPDKEDLNHEEEMCPPKISAPRVDIYASIVDPNKGLVLQFLPVTIIKGLNVRKIDKQNIASEIAYKQIINSTTRHIFLRQKPFAVKAWNEAMVLNVNVVKFLLLSFPDLDIIYCGCDILSKLGSLTGIPIKTDEHIKEKGFLNYASMLN
ncbi:LOW QUALITY PROTEIN: hypothetical protein Cgig2_010248 [Carnegiea gigantea]|uniref:Uncharacterized protein n=1 Tax=Carnegiea gigantea TaxID=171969 RepID=A0A9Q1JP50_9CARY|nr:LOW QUALITY PROTEIN: hypothetical protein Cgig2_010248 [Carnegiea gigantea]